MIWMGGGGVKSGHVHGETDDLGFNVARDPVHVHDLHATILHRDFRLTDVRGHVVREILA